MTKRHLMTNLLVAILVVSLPILAEAEVNNYYNSASSVSVETTQLALQQGTIGNSTIYVNSTSAKVSVAAQENWWDSSWTYRSKINISENSGNDLSNYATSLSINTQGLIANGKMNTDASDMRFIGSSYIYHLPITLNNSQNPTGLIDYQTKVNITDQGILNHIAADGKDLRLFSTQQASPYSEENEIPIWVQAKTVSSLVFWIKANVSSFSTKTLHLYYGNQSATTVSNGTAVFDFYDDFATNTLSDYNVVDLGTVTPPSSWSIATGRMQETSNIYTHGAPDMNGTFAYNTNGDWGSSVFEASAMSTDDDFFGLIFRYTGNDYYRFAWMRQDHTGSGSVGPGRYLHEFSSGTWNTIDSDNIAYVTGQWYDFQIIMNGSYIEVYVDNSLVLNGTGGGSIAGKVGMYDWACQVAYWDNLRIRKIASQEPSISMGIENEIKAECIELSYWIESGVSSLNTKVWVKIPSIPSSGNVAIFMYYGNPNASVRSDGKSTFFRYVNFSSTADGIDGGVSGQDGQGFPSNYEILEAGRTLHIWGNVWKYTTMSTLAIGDGSQILEFNISSLDNGELQGVGISNVISGTDPASTYKFTGSQSWGLAPEVKYSGANGSWQLVSAVLNDFSGTRSYFIWMGDDDADGSQNCSFKDVRVRPYASPEPSFSMGEEEAVNYDYVLEIANQLTNSWEVNLQYVDSINISRLSSASVTLNNGNSSDQIVISNGLVTQTEGPLHDLWEYGTMYIQINNLQASTSGTSILNVYLESKLKNTTVYNSMVLTFEFS